MFKKLSTMIQALNVALFGSGIGLILNMLFSLLLFVVCMASALPTPSRPFKRLKASLKWLLILLFLQGRQVQNNHQLLMFL